MTRDCGHLALIASGEARGLCPLCQREHIRLQAVDIMTLGRQVGELEAEVERLRAALNCIIDMCPVTAEVTLAHQMADCATAALEPKP